MTLEDLKQVEKWKVATCFLLREAFVGGLFLAEVCVLQNPIPGRTVLFRSVKVKQKECHGRLATD
jgi:hypothetical protein